MSDLLILGMFHEATPTADTIDELRALGVPDEQITIMSGIPYKAGMLGRTQAYQRLMPIALFGAVGGLLTALFLTVGTPLLFPIHVGGQPLIPIPPSIIIVFELTMLGTLLATFAGILAESRFPFFGRRAYDFRVTEGHIGLLTRVDAAQAERVEDILTAHGAHHLQRSEVQERVGTHAWSRLALIFSILLIPTALVLLLAFAVITIPLPDQMVNQISTAAQEGPRLAAPAAAVPIQGPELIAGEPATAPQPSTPDSIQRGQVLFGETCQMCHGADGTGSGPLRGFFNPGPADLTSAPIQSLPATEIFKIITNGRSLMPSLAETLSVRDRWDIINYVRTLKK
jgi:mono/diheme cytochrome c family protein